MGQLSLTWVALAGPTRQEDLGVGCSWSHRKDMICAFPLLSAAWPWALPLISPLNWILSFMAKLYEIWGQFAAPSQKWQCTHSVYWLWPPLLGPQRIPDASGCGMRSGSARSGWVLSRRFRAFLCSAPALSPPPPWSLSWCRGSPQSSFYDSKWSTKQPVTARHYWKGHVVLIGSDGWSHLAGKVQEGRIKRSSHPSSFSLGSSGKGTRKCIGDPEICRKREAAGGGTKEKAIFVSICFRFEASPDSVRVILVLRDHSWQW